MADRRQRSQSSADQSRKRGNRENYYSNGKKSRRIQEDDSYSGKKRQARGKSGSSSRKQRKKKGTSAAVKVAIGICSILLILVLAAIGVLASKMSKLNQVKLDPDTLSIDDDLTYDETGYLNVALFGVDTRENDDELGTRSDTIIIASLNRETKEVKLVSVYRDTLLQQDDGTFNKANAAYSFGGAREAIAMLNSNLGLDIQHYVTVDFSAMVDVIDALGGIDIEVTDEELPYINGYAAEITANTGVDTWALEEPGLHHLNGVLATAYARIRYTLGDDYKRTERQRTVLARITEKAQQAELSTLNTIIDRVFPKVETNFSLIEILAYAKDIKKYKLGETTGFPFEKDTMNYGDAGNVVVPVGLYENVRQLYHYLFGTEEEFSSDKVKKIGEELIYQTGIVPEDYGYSNSTNNTYEYGTDGHMYDNGTNSTEYNNYGDGGTYDYGTSDYGTNDYGNDYNYDNDYDYSNNYDYGNDYGSESNDYYGETGNYEDTGY